MNVNTKAQRQERITEEASKIAKENNASQSSITTVREPAKNTFVQLGEKANRTVEKNGRGLVG